MRSFSILFIQHNWHHMWTACWHNVHTFNSLKYSITISAAVITINTVAITDSSHISDNLSDIYPPEHHDVTTCGTPNACPRRPWSTTVWSHQAAWATPLLWRTQVSVHAIPCSWWRRNEEACPVVCWLWHHGALGDPTWVCQCDHTLPKVCWCCVQVVPRVRCRKVLVDSRYGWASRRGFKGRDLITHQLRQIPQGVYCNNDLSHHEKSHPHHGTKLHLCPQLPTKALGKGLPPTPTQVSWPLPQWPIYLGADPWHCMVCTAWHSILSLTLVNTCTPTVASISVTKAKPTKFTTLIDSMKQAIANLSMQSAPMPQNKPSAAAPHDLHCHFCRDEHWKSTSRSTLEMGSAYFATMAMSPYLVDISFPVPLPAKPSKSISISGTTRIWLPPLQLMCLYRVCCPTRQ